MSDDDFLPETYIIPEEAVEKDIKIKKYFEDISIAVNSKDSGFCEGEETVTGKQFLPIFSFDGTSNANYRDVFRKVIDFGTLPNSTTKSIPHGIEIRPEFSLTMLYGAATDPGVNWIPIPYASPIANNNIGLNITIDTVQIITAKNLVNFTRCFVVVEYIKL